MENKENKKARKSRKAKDTETALEKQKIRMTWKHGRSLYIKTEIYNRDLRKTEASENEICRL